MISQSLALLALPAKWQTGKGREKKKRNKKKILRNMYEYLDLLFWANLS
jgi:hypothetical protein